MRLKMVKMSGIDGSTMEPSRVMEKCGGGKVCLLPEKNAWIMKTSGLAPAAANNTPEKGG